MNEKFTLGDYWALLKMSLRKFFWSIDGVDQFNKYGWILRASCIIFFLTMIEYSIRFPFMVPKYFAEQDFEALWKHFECILAVPVLFLITFNYNRLKYALNYKKSIYYKNTGIRPSEIIRDKGTYGEYIGTLAAEKCLETNGVKGKVFNNVLVPQRGGNFCEIDILTVSTMGIHVIEAKAKIGTFKGNLADEKWEQQTGSTVHEVTNPLWQNLWHCNYLSEYLYEELPDCELKRKNVFNQMKNCALFVSNSITDQLSDYVNPNMDYYCGMAETGYAKQKFNTNILSKEEVDMICNAITPIASYSRYEYQQKMQNRQLDIDRGKFKYDKAYHVLEGIYELSDGTPMLNTWLCEEYNGYRFYLDLNDNWYKSIPTMQNIVISRTFNSYNEAVNYYNGAQERAEAESQKWANMANKK